MRDIAISVFASEIINQNITDNSSERASNKVSITTKVKHLQQEKSILMKDGHV